MNLQICPPGWQGVLDSCILFSAPFDLETLDNATERCKELSPHARLFEPRSLWINNLVFNLAKQNGFFEESCCAWLGLNDVNEEGKFLLASTGVPITFSNWKNGEPDGGTGQNHVAFHKDYDGKWVDTTKTYKLQKNKMLFICEISLV